jgi:hypothetical protein
MPAPREMEGVTPPNNALNPTANSGTFMRKAML